MIKVEPILKSKNTFGQVLFTARITFPRIILAELNTHRMLSKNSASSRAIPAKRMQQSIDDNPFFPLAWQKEHKGMQGTEYFDNDWSAVSHLRDQWSLAKTLALTSAKALTESGVTKQLTNRLLEPFMWHTVLISGTEWDNFFNLRCPRYIFHKGDKEWTFKSRKDVIEAFGDDEVVEYESSDVTIKDLTDLQWRLLNKGQAEIHMMELAEQLWDEYNDASIQVLQESEWHIPFEYKLNQLITNEVLRNESQRIPALVKGSVGIAAYTSYTIVGQDKENTIEDWIRIHDKNVDSDPQHSSPLEHPARAMTEIEFYNHSKSYFINKNKITDSMRLEVSNNTMGIDEESENDIVFVVEYGWCRNYRGFIQYRHLLETGQEL